MSGAEVQWLTTRPSPSRRTTGYDAGRSSWKLHAVYASDKETFESIGKARTLCGIRPRHGYDLDAFITDRCKRCETAQSRAGGQ